MATGFVGPFPEQPEWLEMVAGISPGHELYDYGCELACVFMSKRFYFRLILAKWAEAVGVILALKTEGGRLISLALRGFSGLQIAD